MRGQDCERLAEFLRLLGWEQNYEEGLWHFIAPDYSAHIHFGQGWVRAIPTAEAKLPGMLERSIRQTWGYRQWFSAHGWWEKGRPSIRVLAKSLPLDAHIVSPEGIVGAGRFLYRGETPLFLDYLEDTIAGFSEARAHWRDIQKLESLFPIERA